MGKVIRSTHFLFQLLCLTVAFWFLVLLQYILVKEWHPYQVKHGHRNPNSIHDDHEPGLPHDRLIHRRRHNRVKVMRLGGDHDVHRNMLEDFDKAHRGMPHHRNKFGDAMVANKDRNLMLKALGVSHKKHGVAGLSSRKKSSLVRGRMKARKLKRILRGIAPLAPPSAPGELGKAVILDADQLKLGKQKIEEGYNQTGFNRYVSDMISIRRRTLDLRPASCRSLNYPRDLPSTSVIICFHNEARSVLMRTVASVLDKTPASLLHEIILMDDFSDNASLGTQVKDMFSRTHLIRLVRSSSRVGLIGARLIGASTATSPVLTFLDSHVECLRGWIEPMLNRIKQHGQAVVFPVVNSISKDDFRITPVEIEQHGIFNWIDLTYQPRPVPAEILAKRKSPNDPIASPTMPGGIFSIGRKYFDLLGKYDPGLHIWGSENIELSFKTWMCNGTVDLLPCSHVAHVFRDINPNLNDKNMDIVVNNIMRVAFVWMDEYKYLIFNNRINMNEKPRFGDLSKRVKLRKSLHCKDFSWYMKNVMYNFYSPIKAKAIQRIVSAVDSDYCVLHSIHKHEMWGGNCNTYLAAQRLWYLDNGQLRAGMLKFDSPWMCLSVDKDALQMVPCDSPQATAKQQWAYTKEKNIRSVFANKCIQMVAKKDLIFTDCSSDPSQTWILKEPAYTLDMPII